MGFYMIALGLVCAVVIGVVAIVVYLTVGMNLELFFPVWTALSGITAACLWYYVLFYGGPFDMTNAQILCVVFTIHFLYSAYDQGYFQKIWKWLN